MDEKRWEFNQCLEKTTLRKRSLFINILFMANPELAERRVQSHRPETRIGYVVDQVKNILIFSAAIGTVASVGLLEASKNNKARLTKYGHIIRKEARKETQT